MRYLRLVALAVLGVGFCGCKDNAGGGLFSLGEKHLTAPQAQAAVNQAMDQAAHTFRFAKGYSATVEGVQENLPANTATADLAFASAHYHCHINIFVNFEQRWIRGTATFKRYSDGRWVLTEIRPTQQADGLDCLGHWEGSVDVNAASQAGRIVCVNGNCK